jgi:uncharacterized membrane protein HdeD (DUF308 family)
MAANPDTQTPGRGWLIFGGVVSLLVGFFAIGAPGLFSVVLTQFLGALLLVLGVAGVFQALFGKNTAHRVLSLLSALVRGAAGAALLFLTGEGMAILTLILAAVFVAEGLFCVATSFGMKSNPAWSWLFLNGVVALILGGMIFAKWPSDAAWMIGLLYGIQSIFTGFALMMVGFRAQGR